MTEDLPQVVIVGAGFAGLQAARSLAKAPVRVVLVDRRNYHLFQPLLYQVATAGIAAEDIAYPVRAILRRQRNLKFKMAEVTGIDRAARHVHTSGGELSYDYLIIAVGGMTNFFGLNSVEKFGYGLKDIEDAVEVRNHILSMVEMAVQQNDPDLRRAMLTFVVVGGGPTGVEMAGALSELVRLVLAKDYPTLNIKEVRILLLEASDRLLAGMPERLREITAKTLWNKQVEVRFGAQVSDYNGDRVALKSGEVIPARTLIWAAGVRAAGLVDKLGVKQGNLQRVVVTPTLQLPDNPEIFVIGDAAHFSVDGQPPLPMVASVAVQQANMAAINIQRLLNQQQAETFVFKNPGMLATIGRNAAVAQIGSWQVQGFVAWLLWIVIHIVRLIGFRNRVLVLVNWAWDYLLYERAVRLIMPNICRLH